MSDNVNRRKVGEFDGVSGEVVSHQVWGVPANALLLHLPGARRALSSRDGLKKVSAVCNCHLPESLWQVMHNRPDSWNSYLKEVLALVGLSPDGVAALSTGVNMDNLAWAEKAYDELRVSAWVTAGVKSNAMRVGRDGASHLQRDGKFEELGTINIIWLTNASLNTATLAASFIVVTEAKVVALQELDVRSSYTPDWQATGTGTDQIVAVSGREIECTYIGGHSKMGELLAQAVTSATISAVKNGLRES